VEPGLAAAATSAGTVAVLSGGIAMASWRAVVRTGNRRIQFVALAFAILAAKNLVKAIHLASGSPESSFLELVFSLCDLTSVGLIAAPLLMPRGA
jgi:hypothetical protein